MSPPTDARGIPLDADADALTYIAVMNFIQLVGVGVIAISIGLYLRTRIHPDAALWRQAERLALTCARFCPKCGRPLQISECKKENESEFNSLLLCGDCNVGVDYSGRQIFVIGLIFTPLSFILMPVLGCMAFILILAGLGLSGYGVLQWARQLRKAKLYLSQHSTLQKPLQ